MKNTLKNVAASICCALLATVAAADGTPKIVKKVAPEFPSKADGVGAGVVKARLSIGADGRVTEVQVLEATPKRVFDQAAITALMAWRFEGTGKSQSYDVKLVFSDAE